MLLFTADWHVSRSPLPWNPNPLLDISCAIKQICEIVLLKKPEYVFLGGDITDRPSLFPDEIDTLVRFVEVCRKAGSQIVFVQGQHDRSPSVPILSVLDKEAVHLHNRMLHLGDGIVVAGLDFAYEGPKEFLNTQILFTHQSWIRPDFPYGLISWRALPNYRLVLSGDFHSTMICTCPGLPPIVFSGALCPRKITEPKEASVWLIKPPYTEQCAERIPLRTRPWVEIRVRPDTTHQGVVDQVAEQLKQTGDLPREIAEPVIVLAYNEESEPTAHQIRKHFLHYEYLVMRPIRERTHSMMQMSLLPETVDQSKSVLDLFLEMYQDDPRYQDIVTLVKAANSEDVRNILSRIVERVLNEINQSESVLLPEA